MYIAMEDVDSFTFLHVPLILFLKVVWFPKSSQLFVLNIKFNVNYEIEKKDLKLPVGKKRFCFLFQNSVKLSGLRQKTTLFQVRKQIQTKKIQTFRIHHNLVSFYDFPEVSFLFQSQIFKVLPKKTSYLKENFFCLELMLNSKMMKKEHSSAPEGTFQMFL
jgi:hypothetical protein